MTVFGSFHFTINLTIYGLIFIINIISTCRSNYKLVYAHKSIMDRIGLLINLYNFLNDFFHQPIGLPNEGFLGAQNKNQSPRARRFSWVASLDRLWNWCPIGWAFPIVTNNWLQNWSWMHITNPIQSRSFSMLNMHIFGKLIIHYSLAWLKDAKKSDQTIVSTEGGDRGVVGTDRYFIKQKKILKRN